VTETEDALDALKEMDEHVQARRNAEAVAAAEQVVRLAREIDNPRVKRILLATATSTWLTSKAAVDPGDTDLMPRCDRAFERFSKASFEQAPTTAIIALGVKIQLLLQSRPPREAEQVSGDLAAFYPTRPAGAKSAQQAGEVVKIACDMIAMRAPVPGAELARSVVERLADSPTPEEALLAATAQAWVVVASIYIGEPVPGIPVVQNAVELRSLLDADDPPGLALGGKDTDRLIAMGDPAIEAVDTLVQRMRKARPDWDHPRIVLSTAKIAALQELGRRDECRAAVQAFVAEFSDTHDWRVDGVAQWYQRELQQP
jgi:hypothetical protein